MMDITLAVGSKYQLLCFSAMNEERVRALPGDALADYSERGFLMPLFMMLASLSNVARLIRLKEQAQAPRS